MTTSKLHLAVFGANIVNRILVIFIFVMLVFSVIPAAVFADNGYSEPTSSSAESKSEALQVSVTVKGEGLRIKWKKLDGAESYNVYRSYRKNSGYKLLKKGITGRSYNDKTVASGKKAYYKVRAVKADGSRMCCSKKVCGIIYRVYIETGHGTDIKNIWDPGCSWSGYQEARLMIPICQAAANYLSAKGVYVYTDAFGNNNRNLKYTLKFVKEHSVSVLLNVHCDYCYAPSGTMPLYRYSDQKKLAKCLNEGVHEYIKIKDRGLVRRTDLDTLNKSPGYCVACLFETGSISNDNRLLRTRYKSYGKGLAKGICDYLKVEW